MSSFSDTASSAEAAQKHEFEDVDLHRQDAAATASPVSRLFQNPWTIYVASTMASLLALVATYCLLYAFNGKQQSQWPHSISLNTALSILTVLLKTTMMAVVAACTGQLKWSWFSQARPLKDLHVFDAASRGNLWASAHLAYIQKFRHLASIGALLTILAIALEPFIQNAIKYESCPSSNTAAASAGPQATLPISKNYTPTALGNALPGDVNMLGAFYNGLLQPQALTYSCPSGNCEFSDYQTLGFCSTCYNDAQASQKTLQYQSYPEQQCAPEILQLSVSTPGAVGAYSLPLQPEGTNPNLIEILPFLAPNIESRSPTYNDSLPSPDLSRLQYIGSPVFAYTVTSVTNSDSCTFNWINGGSVQDSDCINPAQYIKSQNSSIDTSQAGSFCTESAASPAVFVPLDTWPNLVTSTCAVSICGKRYNATVVQSGGGVNESLIEASDMIPFQLTNSKNELQSYVFVSTACYVKGQLVPLDQYVLDEQARAGANQNYTAIQEMAATHSSRAASLLETCSFYLSAESWMDLSSNYPQYLLWGNGSIPALSSSSSSASTQGPLSVGINTTGFIPWLEHVQAVTWSPGAYLQGFLGQGGPTHQLITQTSAQLAFALELNIRTRDSANSSAVGTAHGGDATCIRIRYGWLAFTSALVGTNAIFLLLTMLASSFKAKNGVAATSNGWMNKLLPMLFTGLDEGLKAEFARRRRRQQSSQRRGDADTHRSSETELGEEQQQQQQQRDMHELSESVCAVLVRTGEGLLKFALDNRASNSSSV